LGVKFAGGLFHDLPDRSFVDPVPLHYEVDDRIAQ
jgi:hypothetical protein